MAKLTLRNTPAIPETSREFLGLFRNQTWMPILRQPDGKWKKVCNYATPERIDSLVLDPTKTVGVRALSKTSYLMLDIDWKQGRAPSIYHPASAGGFGWQELRAALEEIGLCRYLMVRSSAGEASGVHVYFPLAESVSSIELSRRVTEYLEALHFRVTSGVLELFPNRKGCTAYFKAHAIPLQKPGTCLIGEDGQPLGSSHELFMQQWNLAAQGQDYETFHAFLTQDRQAAAKGKGLRQVYHDLFVVGYTGFGQSNEIGSKVAFYGLCALGLTDEDKLTRYIQTHWPKVPNYDLYTSEETKADTGWARRKAKHILRSGLVPAKGAGKLYPGLEQPKPKNPNLNEERYEDAYSRLQEGLVAAKSERFANFSALLKFLVNRCGMSIRTIYKRYHSLVKAAFEALSGSETAEAHIEQQQEEILEEIRSYSPAARVFSPKYRLLLDLKAMADLIAGLLRRPTPTFPELFEPQLC